MLARSRNCRSINTRTFCSSQTKVAPNHVVLYRSSNTCAGRDVRRWLLVTDGSHEMNGIGFCCSNAFCGYHRFTTDHSRAGASCARFSYRMTSRTSASVNGRTGRFPSSIRLTSSILLPRRSPITRWEPAPPCSRLNSTGTIPFIGVSSSRLG